MRRAILTLLLTMVAMVAAAGNASAVDLPGQDCRKPPIPASPVGGIDPGPAAPRDGDPFDPKSGVSLYEAYGWAGLEPVMFDTGCSPVQFSLVPIAGMVSGQAATMAQVGVRAWRIVTDGTLSTVIDPMQGLFAHILGWSFFVPLLGFAVMATGAWILLKSKRMKLAQTGRYSMNMLLIIGVGVLTLLYPLLIGPVMDKTVSDVITAANVSMTANGQAVNVSDAIAANVQQYVLYPTWVNQTFGPENAAAATEFGPALFKAGAFTRTEQKAIDADPSKAGEMIDAKQNEYKAVGKQIQDKYPQAYDYLAGNQGMNAMQQSLLALIGVPCAMLFLLYALWKVLYGLVLTRVVIGIAPGIALVSQHPAGQPIFWKTLSSVWTALVGGVVAGVLGSIFLVVGVGGTLSATGISPFVKIIVLLVLTVIMMRIMKMSSKSLKRHKGELPAKLSKGKAQPAQPASPSRAANAAKGAFVAGASTALAGVVTGGTVTAGAMAAGAAKGAVAGAAAPKVALPAGAGPAWASSPAPSESPALNGAPVPAIQSSVYTPIESRKVSPEMPKKPTVPRLPKAIEPTRIYQPHEPLPTTPAPARVRIDPDGTTVYRIYSPLVPA